MSLLMRKLLATLALLFPVLALAGDGFLMGIEDLPLVPGLTEAAGGGIVFDSPQGRIVETEAMGAVTKEQVLAFYAQTLPQLGWNRISDTEYRSESEILHLSFTPAAAKGQLVVHFNLNPNNH